MRIFPGKNRLKNAHYLSAYGLRVDRIVDERVDPWRATVAASIYLSDLNNVFNSWYLAMAAYNAGEGRIMGAIMRHKTRNFWELVRKKALPSETMNYIPKVLAAYIIGKNPEKYGFRVPDAESHEAFAGVTVPSPIQLSSVADETQIPLDDLKKFNPHLKSGITPQDASTYKIWIPKRFETAFKDSASKLAEHRTSAKAQVRVASKGKIRTFHRVKRGEHLTAISNKYGISIAKLKKMNNLRGNVLYRGQKLKVMTDKTQSAVADSSSKGKTQSATYKCRRPRESADSGPDPSLTER